MWQKSTFFSADTHKNVDFFEVVFNESNFLHLTGVHVRNNVN